MTPLVHKLRHLVEENQSSNLIQDPIWDASVDGKSVIQNKTLADVFALVKRTLPGATTTIGTFTMFDLKNGEHVEIIFRKGLKNLRLRIQRHPMEVNKLKKTPDSSGIVN